MLPMDRPHEDSFTQRPNSKSIMLRKDGKDVGFVAYNLETCDLGTEIVIEGLYIEPSAGIKDIFPALNLVISALGKLHQCVSARFHTVRAGLVAQANAHGWYPSEIIVRKLI